MGTWSLTGNALGASATGFLGTTDNNALVIKTGSPSTERLRVDPTGNVGIGTAAPTVALHLAIGKVLRIEGGTSGTDANDHFSFGGYGTFGIDAPGVINGRLVVQNSGNVGIGTPSPVSRLHVNGDLTVSATATSRSNIVLYAGDTSYSVGVGIVQPGSYSVISSITAAPSSAEFTIGSQLTFSVFPIVPRHGFPTPPHPAPVEAMRINESRQVGIGTSAPIASLDVNGQVCCKGPLAVNNATAAAGLGEPSTDPRAGITFGATDTPSAFYLGAINSDTRANTALGILSHASGNWLQAWSPSGDVSFAGNVSAAGNVSVTGDVLLTGADCAEEFDACGTQPPDAGTVMVIDAGGALRESVDAYDKRVAGVVSGGGDYKHALVLDKQSSDKPRVPLALVGKVYCKVDARYSPVEVGDLLTTSPTPGHAMKATEPRRAFGCVIGKALKPLECGQGLIPILVSLQ